MGFVNNAFKSFGKGSQSIGTWFGVSKQRTSGLAHFFGVPRGEDPADAAAAAAAADEATAADAALNAQNAGAAAGRRRSRLGSALATGAPDSGTAATTSAIAYGKPTLGG